MMQPQIFGVQVQWLSPQVGGRSRPPIGPTYAPTVQFADAPDQQFSVVFLLASQDGGAQPVQDAELRILHQDMARELAPQFRPGRQLLIHEGKRVVGICTVQSVGAVTPLERAASAIL